MREMDFTNEMTNPQFVAVQRRRGNGKSYLDSLADMLLTVREFDKLSDIFKDL